MRSSCPCLKGRGAEAKDLWEPITHVWRTLARGHRDYEAVLRMLTAMVDVQEILHATKDDSFLSLDECDKVEALVDTFLLEYQKLAAAADVAKVFLWKNPSKFHFQ